MRRGGRERARGLQSETRRWRCTRGVYRLYRQCMHTAVRCLHPVLGGERRRGGRTGQTRAPARPNSVLTSRLLLVACSRSRADRARLGFPHGRVSCKRPPRDSRAAAVSARHYTVSGQRHYYTVSGQRHYYTVSGQRH